MTTDRRADLDDDANALASEGKFSDAGDTYVQAGFEEAGEWFGASSWGQELRMLYKACLCYRLADQSRQCRFAATLGIRLAEEYATRADERPEPSHPPDKAEQGVWHEFVGDFRLVAGLDDVSTAYDRAKDHYRAAGDPFADFGEGPIGVAQAVFSTTVLVAGADHDLITDSTQGRLTDWVDYKRVHLPDLIDGLVASGVWHKQE